MLSNYLKFTIINHIVSFVPVYRLVSLVIVIKLNILYF